jgi:hypothetical protein
MVPFNFALEANNLGQIFDLSLALLLLVNRRLLVVVVGDKPKSTVDGFRVARTRGTTRRTQRFERRG